MGLFSSFFNPSKDTDYVNAYNNTNKLLQNQSNLNNQYTGNQGYQNSIQQGLTGANVTAGAAGQNAQKAARNTGMSRAAAANLGAANAANSYSNNFNNQQQNAYNAGMNAINANSNLAGLYQGQASQAAGYSQDLYNRKKNAISTVGNVASNIGSLFSALSDERMKDIQAKSDNISKLVENIPSYVYEYKKEAKEKYPEETNSDLNIGPMAQDLEKNPVLENAVEEDDSGIKHVNGSRLALDAIALISDMSKRISELEDK